MSEHNAESCPSHPNPLWKRAMECLKNGNQTEALQLAATARQHLGYVDEKFAKIIPGILEGDQTDPVIVVPPYQEQSQTEDTIDSSR